MDTRDLGLGRQQAGLEYLASVERLGLRPTVLLWVFDRDLAQFALILVTPMFDYAGPFELSKVIVEAYRKSGTPKEIDPFIVRTYSPDHTLIRNMFNVIPVRDSVIIRDRDGKIASATYTFTFGDLEVSTDWIYRFEVAGAIKTVEIGRRWKRFVTNVDRLAA